MSRILVVLLALPALLLPAVALAYTMFKGAGVVDWTFIASSEEGVAFGVSRGILPQIVGSLSLALGACLLAAPMALGAALYYRLLASPARRRLLQSLLNLLQGIPPVVFGLCGLLVLVHGLRWGISLASGVVVLALVVLPLLVLNTVVVLARLPVEYDEAARALGLDHGALIVRVWLPQAWPGILSGLFLAVARALSETAPILLTATVFSGVRWPDSIFSPVTSLQTHIFYLAQEGADPRAVAVAWGSALVLVGLVLMFALLARSLRKWGSP